MEVAKRWVLSPMHRLREIAIYGWRLSCRWIPPYDLIKFDVAESTVCFSNIYATLPNMGPILKK